MKNTNLTIFIVVFGFMSLQSVDARKRRWGNNPVSSTILSLPSSSLPSAPGLGDVCQEENGCADSENQICVYVGSNWPARCQLRTNPCGSCASGQTCDLKATGFLRVYECRATNDCGETCTGTQICASSKSGGSAACVDRWNPCGKQCSSTEKCVISKASAGQFGQFVYECQRWLTCDPPCSNSQICARNMADIWRNGDGPARCLPKDDPCESSCGSGKVCSKEGDSLYKCVDKPPCDGACGSDQVCARNSFGTEERCLPKDDPCEGTCQADEECIGVRPCGIPGPCPTLYRCKLRGLPPPPPYA